MGVVAPSSCAYETRMGAVVVDGVSAGYGASRVLSGINLELKPGEVNVLIGPNGAGKSTLVRVIAGLMKPSEGRVCLLGDDIAQLDRAAIARRVAVVPQSEDPAFGYSVRQVVSLGRAPLQGAWMRLSAADEAVVEESLGACEIQHLAARDVTTLSGGEKKRVIVARAFAQRAPILLLDEAGAHLDVRHALDLHEVLRKQVEERQLACLAVLHDLNIAAQFADRVALLVDGRLEAHGPVDEVMTWKRLRDAFGTDLYVGVNELTQMRYFVPMRPLSRPRPPSDL